jgi:hypothetical protein
MVDCTAVNAAGWIAAPRMAVGARHASPLQGYGVRAGHRPYPPGNAWDGCGAEISYGAPAASGSVRNIAMASISTSSSGRHRMAWIPVEAGSGSSSCSS